MLMFSYINYFVIDQFWVRKGRRLAKWTFNTNRVLTAMFIVD